MLGEILITIFQFLLEEIFGRFFIAIGTILLWLFYLGRIPYVEISKNKKKISGWIGFTFVLAILLAMFYIN